MRLFASLLLVCAVTLLAGCVQTKGSARSPGAANGAPAGTASTPPASAPKPAGIAEAALVGRVIAINPSARFAVLSFPLGQMPAIDQHLGVYRAGVKVGEVKASGPQRDDNIVADILAGDCQTGDEVWDK